MGDCWLLLLLNVGCRGSAGYWWLGWWAGAGLLGVAGLLGWLLVVVGRWGGRLVGRPTSLIPYASLLPLCLKRVLMHKA